MTWMLWLWACAAPQGEADADADGFVASKDCDDASASVHPDAEEQCNGADDNCDGTADEGLTGLWYADADEDGAGDPTATSTTCAAPAGYVATGDDCDDVDPAVRPGVDEACDGVDNDCDGEVDEAGADGEVAFYLDADGDDYGDTASARYACSPAAGEVSVAGDCDDSNATVNPGEAERCDAADTDEDCDGEAEEAGALESEELFVDADGDGYGAGAAVDVCDPGGGYANNGEDCDDGDAGVNPAAAEVCGGGDENCDGAVDESGAGGATAFYTDADGDAYGVGSAVYLCGSTTGYSAISGDCDDTRAEVSPREVERCDPEDLDEDCNGVADDAAATDQVTWLVDADGDGYGGVLSITSCTQPSGYVEQPGDCDDSRADVNPGDTERCDGSNTDENCDGVADDATATDQRWFYLDDDGDGYGGTGLTTACDLAAGLSTTGDDCDDGEAAVHPGATELCDAADVDEDCDGLAEEPDALGGSTWYLDVDGDGWGGATTTVACDAGGGRTGRGGDCDDGRAEVYPGAPERCDAADLDEDCDGTAEDADSSADGVSLYVDGDGDGFGDGVSRIGCDPDETEASVDGDCDDTRGDVSPLGVEVCDALNADEDCDGAADDADPDVDLRDGTQFYTDADEDGYGDPAAPVVHCDAGKAWISEASDCDDTQDAVHPGSVEDCSTTADDDCDGETNEVDALACINVYVDGDGDGYGAGPAACWCTPPDGYALVASDCVDADATRHPTPWYPDADGDGFGDASSPTESCTRPSGYLSDGSDCDDGDATVKPTATEVYGDEEDEDCDGATWPTDVCPFGATQIPGAYETIQEAIAAGRTQICVDGTVQSAATTGASVTISDATSITIFGQGTEFSVVSGGIILDNDLASLTVTNLTLNGAIVAMGGDVTLDGLRIIADGYASVTAVSASSTGGSMPYIYVSNSEISGWDYAVQASASSGSGEADLVLINCWVHDNGYAGRSNASPSSGAPYTWIGSYHNTYTDNGRGLTTAHSGSGYAEIESYDDIWTDTGLCALSRSSSSASNEAVSAGESAYWNNGYNMCNGVTLTSPLLDDPELDMSLTPPEPSSSSPVVDMGSNVWSDGRDFWGDPRIGNPDYGCIEVR